LTRRDRVPNLRSTAGKFALGAAALLSAACASVPDLIFDSGDARAEGGDARAEGGDASRSSDGSGMEASAQSDACANCQGLTCAERCSECAATCPSGTTCCAKVSAPAPVMCKPLGKACPQ
jgi:hypothetical protein